MSLNDIEDRAELEYNSLSAHKTRTETLRIWNGVRYVWRTVEMHDIGRPAKVEPSKLKKVSNRATQGTTNPLLTPTATLIVEYIEENGPQRFIGLRDNLDLPPGTIFYSLRHTACFLQAPDKIWHLNRVEL